MFAAAVFASISMTQAGVEYKMLRENWTPLDLNPSDVVQLVGVFGNPDSIALSGIYEGEDSYGWVAGSRELQNGFIFTGLTKIRFVGQVTNAVTLKITTKDDPAVPAQSNQVAVIPEDGNGQYEVALESSTDFITWTPANSGTYGGTTAKRFFRTRIVKKVPAE